MDLSTATDVANNIITSGAVVIGGVWVYFNYIRGRTFARRAELGVTSSLERGNSLYLCATVTLKNSGQSNLPLNENMKVIRLSGIADRTSDGIGVAKWQRIMTLPILEQHAWLEALETVTDTVVYSLPCASGGGPHYSAYQVEAIVGTRRRLISRRGTLWQSRTVLFAPTASATGKDPSSHQLIRPESSKEITRMDDYDNDGKATEGIWQGGRNSDPRRAIPTGIAGMDGGPGIDGGPGMDGGPGIDGLPGIDGGPGIDGSPGIGVAPC